MAFGHHDYSITNLTDADVANAVTRAAFDVVVFPGGSGNAQAEAIGPTGIAALRAFVADGGGYIGTCGGAFLGLQHALAMLIGIATAGCTAVMAHFERSISRPHRGYRIGTPSCGWGRHSARNRARAASARSQQPSHASGAASPDPVYDPVYAVVLCGIIPRTSAAIQEIDSGQREAIHCLRRVVGG